MSTSILYHAFGLKNVKYLRTRNEEGHTIFDAEIDRELAVCPQCGSHDTKYRGFMERLFHLVPIGGRKTFLRLKIHRLDCRRCENVLWPHLPFAEPRCSYTRGFARFAIELLRHTTLQSAAELLGVGWDMIKSIHKKALGRWYKKIDLSKVRYIGIDEFSLRKGHVYMTIVVDLESGRILHAAEGKAGEVVLPFLKTLARKAKRLEAVAMDMHEGFIRAVKEALPKVEIVLDHYHIMALMNRAIDDCRREHQAELDKIGMQTVKGCRFLLLRNYQDLSDEHRERLDLLLKTNQPLLVMHTMKEQLRELWKLPGYKTGLEFIEAWCRDAMNSGIRALMKVGKTLALHRSLILSYFFHPISSGKIEGINNKIKTMKRQAYGFRDIEYFKLRLYHLHEQKHSLTG